MKTPHYVVCDKWSSLLPSKREALTEAKALRAQGRFASVWSEEDYAKYVARSVKP